MARPSPIHARLSLLPLVAKSRHQTYSRESDSWLMSEQAHWLTYIPYLRSPTPEIRSPIPLFSLSAADKIHTGFDEFTSKPLLTYQHRHRMRAPTTLKSCARSNARRFSAGSAAVLPVRTARTVGRTTHVPETPAGLRPDNANASQTEQTVWLANQSLAASVACKSNAANESRRQGETAGHDKQHPANTASLSSNLAWNGPTVWAHLW
jgi:hypothetical protein